MEQPMDETDDDHTTQLPAVPPDWIWAVDFPSLLAKWHRVSVAIVALEATDALWTGHLSFCHRIAGVEPHGNTKKLPPGLQWSHDDPRWSCDYLSFGRETYVGAYDRIVAYDWTLAEVDRLRGTVGGWPDEAGIRQRHPIELPWVAGKAWAELRLEQWRQQDEAARDRPGNLEQRPTPGKTKLIRKGRYNWGPALEKISLELHAHGIPERWDGGQTRLEALATEAFPLDKCPSVSTIRNKVSVLIEKHRKATGQR
jgi:hypothetical protein